MLDQRGIGDRFVAEGQTFPAIGYSLISMNVSDFPTRHNYVLALWQSHIERILLDWINELGVPILRSRAVTGFTSSDTHIDVEPSDGSSLRAQYLVGCDGGRSLVRKAAGIEFPGLAASTRCMLAEVEMDDQPEFGSVATASASTPSAAACPASRSATCSPNASPSTPGTRRWSSSARPSSVSTARTSGSRTPTGSPGSPTRHGTGPPTARAGSCSLANGGIAQRLVVSERTVEAHVRHVLMKLDLNGDDGHRRVLAVLAHLRAGDTAVRFLRRNGVSWGGSASDRRPEPVSDCTRRQW